MTSSGVSTHFSNRFRFYFREELSFSAAPLHASQLQRLSSRKVSLVMPEVASLVDGVLAHAQGEGGLRFSGIIEVSRSLGLDKVSIHEKIKEETRGGRVATRSLGWSNAIYSRTPGGVVDGYLWLRSWCTPWKRSYYFACYTCISLCIVWFTASIDFTIHLDEVRGVGAINNTGRLIPFIIDVSATHISQELALLMLRKAKPRRNPKLNGAANTCQSIPAGIT